MNDLTHASFFSGVGGLDLGLERAGWRTVSFSEIDPYASAVLAERWPGIPNLGDIVRLAERGRSDQQHEGDGAVADPLEESGASGATLWSGGFPCQDLSVAGKRHGFAGARSSLAFAFLDLVERHRPPAILFENVPGLLSSHRGRDFGTLLDRLAQLGYGWAYRILDARHFGVPQRRRRVFIVALNLERGFGADSAAAVLSVGTRCPRHPATGHATGEGAAASPGNGISHALSPSHTRSGRYDPNGETYVTPSVRAGGHGDPGIGRDNDEERLVLSPSPDPGGVRAPDGLAGRMDDLAPTLRVGPARPQDGGPGDTVPIVADTLNSGGNNGGFRTEPGAHLIAGAISEGVDGSARVGSGDADRYLPLGLDSHRYRCCGNGVVSSVAEWIGIRLAEALA